MRTPWMVAAVAMLLESHAGPAFRGFAGFEDCELPCPHGHPAAGAAPPPPHSVW